jgi:uncharacterized protein (TIRG00374 family)
VRIGVRSAIGIALSVALLAWTLWDVHWDEVRRELVRTNLPLMIAAVVAGTLIFPLRAIRWRVILDPVQPHLPFGALFRATAIGFMVNNVAPARLGEPARAFALSREVPSVPFSSAFASLAVDRLLDALVLLLLLVLAMLDPRFPTGTRIADRPIEDWAGNATFLLAALMVILYLLVLLPGRVIGLYSLFARRISPKLEERGRDALLAFASGLGILRRPGRFGILLFWTVAHWLLNAFAFWLAFRAVGIDVPFSAAMFVQGAIAIGVAVPSSPGFFGVFEAVALVSLRVYGVSDTQAITWAISYHLLSFIPITVIGAWYFSQLKLHFGDLRRAVAPRA